MASEGQAALRKTEAADSRESFQRTSGQHLAVPRHGNRGLALKAAEADHCGYSSC